MKKGMLVLATVLWALGLAYAAERQALVAKKVTGPPIIDGVVDSAWEGASPLTIRVMGGRNLPNGSTEVILRAIYTDDNIYFLAQWKDPTESLRRSPWQKQTDGSWRKLSDPTDRGGDNNLFYEDKFAMLWNISIPDLEKNSWMVVAHLGEGKPYGNKYTLNPGETADMWHWKGVRTNPVGQVDDQYLDSTRYDKAKAPEAGRKSDPKTAGGYFDNINEAKTGPKWATKGNNPAPPYWILDSEKEPIDDSKYKPGDEVPGIVVAPFVGDRADISARGIWKDGVWTLEFGRKLVTGSQFDIQFSDLKKAYLFGAAVFDNAQVRHAFNPTPQVLIFESRPGAF